MASVEAGEGAFRGELLPRAAAESTKGFRIVAKHAKKSTARLVVARSTASVAMAAVGLLTVTGMSYAGGDPDKGGKDDDKGKTEPTNQTVIVVEEDNSEDNDSNEFEDNVAPILNNVVNDTNVVVPVQACGNDVNVLAIQATDDEGGDETECEQDTNTDNDVDASKEHGGDGKGGGTSVGHGDNQTVIIEQDDSSEDNDENSFEDNVLPILNNVVNDVNAVVPIQACGNDVNVLAIQAGDEDSGDETSCRQDTNTDNEVDVEKGDG